MDTESIVDWNFTEPSLPIFKAFEFERFNLLKARQFMAAHWPFTVYISMVYVIFVFLGPYLMKRRSAFNLRYLLTAWNILLATFSIIGFLRTVPELLYVLAGPSGFHNSVCVRANHFESCGFWALAFTLSKVLELGDTVFVVLRKRPLIFLHWYHHITVMIITSYTYASYEPIFRWFGVMNYFAHSLMYPYYTLKACKVTVPRCFPMTVTVVQLSQMAVALVVNIYAIWILQNGGDCARSWHGIKVHLWMYASYMLLFLHFFYMAYLIRPKPKRE